MSTNDFEPTLPAGLLITAIAVMITGFALFLVAAFREEHPRTHDGNLTAVGIGLMVAGWAAAIVFVASGIRL